MQSSNQPELNAIVEAIPTSSTNISHFTHALIKSWQGGQLRSFTSANKISVSQTVSFVAFLYVALAALMPSFICFEDNLDRMAISFKLGQHFLAKIRTETPMRKHEDYIILYIDINYLSKTFYIKINVN